jgi:hypothetical protein
MDNGLSAAQIGALKSIGLVFKFVGEPIWCYLADMTDTKIIFAICMLMQVSLNNTHKHTHIYGPLNAIEFNGTCANV